MKMADYVRSMPHSCLSFSTWSFYFLVCSKELLDETKAVGRIWDVDVGELTMKSLGASGREYVYVYKYHTNCSEVGLHELEEFMCIDKATTSTIIVTTATATATATTATSSIMATTASTASLDIDPFLYDNHGLLQLQPNNSSLVAALAVPVPPASTHG